MNRSKPNILVVPNEDGFGPSALSSYIVDSLLKRSHSQITIWNKSRFAYNRRLYDNHIKDERLNVSAIWNIIQLDKRQGKVSIAGTLEKIGDYRNQSNQYPFGVRFTDFDLVLDFGVPAAAGWAVKNGIRSVSVFDHSWSKTLEMILTDEDRLYPREPRVSNTFRLEWHRLIKEIRKDESLTQELFIFPTFITPIVFQEYWQQIIGRSAVNQMDSVLGGKVMKEDAEKTLEETIGQLQEGQTILIQGGDTPVWDDALKKLVNEFIRAEKELSKDNLNIAIYIPDRLRTNQIMPETFLNNRLKRVRAFGYVQGGTIQKILPAIDFLVTRAGGGSVNDAVACRVPFICVEETAQSQVQAVLHACQDRGLTRPISSRDFEHDPKEVILREFKKTNENQQALRNMNNTSCMGEDWLANHILALCERM